MAEAKLGTVLDAGLFGIRGVPGHFVKTRVKLNVMEPLRSQLFASNPSVGKFWFTLVYEHLPLYCYHCGRFGHTGQNCEFPPPTGEEYFGPGLTTKESCHRLNEKLVPIHGAPLQKTVWVNPITQGKKRNGEEAQLEMASQERGETTRRVVLALPAEGSNGSKEKRVLGGKQGAPSGVDTGKEGKREGATGSNGHEAAGPRDKSKGVKASLKSR
ncbi:unnamed protein product [Linum trigynum]|uniref:CCHC-type domain-containing protein n=1 Tax=Linum trigynum TaxID=586398 RepID=A0AAV2D958_9ROSI